MTVVKIRKSYREVTKKWIDSAIPNSHRIKNREYFEDEKGRRYYVDGKNVVLDYSRKEKEIALWLEKTFGGELYMIPRVNSPEGIATPDYLFRNDYWDLKEIFGNSKHTLDTAIKKKKNQANNFIFDICSSEITRKEAVCQIRQIFHAKERAWVENVILKDKETVIAVFERKKRLTISPKTRTKTNLNK